MINMIRLVLREDKRYNYSKFRELIRSQNIKDCDDKCVRNMFDRVRDYIAKKLGPVIANVKRMGWIDIESSAPLASDDEFNLGQWVGMFKLDETMGGREVIIEVEPKIGWDLFNRMLNDALKLPVMLGHASLRPIMHNLLPSAEYVADIIYSALAREYTEMAFTEPLPKIVEYRWMISEGQLGKVDVRETARLQFLGVPLIVSLRLSLANALPPMVMLARFHYKLFMRLRELSESLRKLSGTNTLEPTRSWIEELMMCHWYILTSSPLSAYLDLAVNMDIDDEELIRETRERSGVNTWLRALADVYEAYNARIAGAEVKEPKVPIQLLPSSKVFELWVLGLLIKALGIDLRRSHVLGGSYSISIRDGNIKLNYNRYYRKFLITKLIDKKLLSEKAKLRPDYVIRINKVNIVADAKYKFILDIDDFERMAAYIINTATPLDVDGRALIGMFIMLTDNDGTGSPEVHRIPRNSGISENIELRAVKITPKYPDESINKLKNALPFG